jgi:hypothetical protein
LSACQKVVENGIDIPLHLPESFEKIIPVSSSFYKSHKEHLHFNNFWVS